VLSVSVTLSQSQVEKLMNIIEESERNLLEARSILTMNTSTKPASSTPTQQMVPNIDRVQWRVKGGRSAGSGDDFAFDFTQDRDGKVQREKALIIDYIKVKGPFRVENYDVTLSKDGKFLQRVKV
jgi:hypothetical protein